jgi:hypothetical protein
LNQIGETLQLTESIAEEHGDAEDKAKLPVLRGSVEAAIQARDAGTLREKIEELNAIRFPLLLAQPGWWVGYFSYLKEQRASMAQETLADQLTAQGDRAIAAGDLEAMKNVCQQLVNLLPKDEQDKARGYGGGTVKK